ncbi:MAG: PLP-dependent aspartate aminotransferase family protein [Candidatus Sericytochromatia bacterium]
MDYSYIINKLGENRENYFNAVSPPIIQTSNFAFNSVNEMKVALSNEKEISCYTRGKNPTVDILNQKIAALEGSESALTVSSGVSAISLSILSNIKKGEHIVCVKDPYSWTNKLLNNFLPKFGVETTMIDGKNIGNWKDSIKKNTKIFYLETPNSFTFELQDIKEISKIAKENNIITIVDNSYSTFINQKPLELGADIVIYSATKYIGGHSDVVAGIICSNNEMINKIFYNEFMTFGNIISPNDAWLLIRGLRTLKIRLDKITDNAKKIIKYLKTQEKVLEILYPFDENFKQYDLAIKQMKDATGLFTVRFDFKNKTQAEKFSNSIKNFLLAVSWGGHESLILPTCVFPNENTPYDYVRFYTGLEEADFLINDIDNALKAI